MLHSVTARKALRHYEHSQGVNEGKSTNRLQYSGKKKYVNPLELPGFLHKLVIQFHLLFILVTTIDKHSVLIHKHTNYCIFLVHIEYII